MSMLSSFGYVPHKVIWRDIVFKIFGWPDLIRRIQAPIIMRMLGVARDDNILDAGCAGGNFSFEVAKRSRICTGADIELNENVSLAMKSADNLFFVKCDIQSLPFKDKTFHKVLLSSVLQMVKDDRALLRECHRVLKDKSDLVLSVPLEYQWIKYLNDIRDQLKNVFGAKGKGFYELAEVTALLEDAGFKIAETEYAPKRCGSLIYELCLFLRHSLGLPLFSPYSFFFLFPFGFLDSIIGSRNQMGNEIVIKAVKNG